MSYNPVQSYTYRITPLDLFDRCTYQTKGPISIKDLNVRAHDKRERESGRGREREKKTFRPLVYLIFVPQAHTFFSLSDKIFIHELKPNTKAFGVFGIVHSS